LAQAFGSASYVVLEIGGSKDRRKPIDGQCRATKSRVDTAGATTKFREYSTETGERGEGKRNQCVPSKSHEILKGSQRRGLLR